MPAVLSIALTVSCASFSNKKPIEYRPVQYAKNDYRVLKKENRYTGTFMIRQKVPGDWKTCILQAQKALKIFLEQ